MKINSIRKQVKERPEFRAKGGKLQSVVFRQANKGRAQTRHIGKKTKEFKFYKRSYEMGIFNSADTRRKNAKKRK